MQRHFKKVRCVGWVFVLPDCFYWFCRTFLFPKLLQELFSPNWVQLYPFWLISCLNRVCERSYNTQAFACQRVGFWHNCFFCASVSCFWPNLPHKGFAPQRTRARPPMQGNFSPQPRRACHLAESRTVPNGKALHRKCTKSRHHTHELYLPKQIL